MERSASKILIVDDEPDLREIIALDFEMAGYEVKCAGDGKEALDLLKTEKVDAIVSDVRMPRSDGIHLLKEIRKNDTKDALPMIFITGFSDMTPEEAYNLGIDGIFTKPFDRKILVNSVNNVLIPNLERWKKAPEKALENRPRHLIVLPSFDKARLDKQISLGRGGMFVLKTENFPVVGDLISFRVEFEDRPLLPIEGSGWVRWVRPLQNENFLPGIGIEFQSLTPPSVAYVKEILELFKTNSFIPKG